MIEKYYLMAFLLIGNDGWRIGDRLDGELFEPAPYASLETCLTDRLDRQSMAVRPNGVTKMHWACVPDFNN